MKRFLVLILLIALALAATEKKSDEKVAEKRKYYNDGPDWFFRKAVANFFRAFDYLSRVVRHRRGGPNREVRKIGAGRIGGPSKKGGFGGQQQRPPQSQQRPPQGEQQQGEQGEQQQGPGVQTLQGSQQRPPQQQGPSGQQTLQGTQQRAPQQGAGIFGNRPPGGSLFGGSGERYGEEEGHDQQAEDAFKRGIDLILAVINSQGISKKRSVGRTVREPKNFNHNNQDADLQEEREGFLPAFYVGYDFVVQYLTQALRDNPEWFDVEEFGWEFLQAWDVILDDYFTGGFGRLGGPGPIVPAGPAGNSGFRPGPGGNSGFRPGPGGNSGFRPGPGGRKEEEPEEKK